MYKEIYSNHFKELKVEQGISKIDFPIRCDLLICGGKCCYYGVMLDKKEMQNIISYSEQILDVMDETQCKDVDKWFDELEKDASFPSGEATGTQVYQKKCVFLNKASLCSLQIVSEKVGKDIKPFYCKIFPFTIEENTITIDRFHIQRIGGCVNSKIKSDKVTNSYQLEKQIIEQITNIKI